MTVPGLQEFLHDYADMALRPVRAGEPLGIAGTFRFSANNAEVVDSYELLVAIDDALLEEPPRVFETAGRIPRDGNYHVNPDDTLCLGSPLRVRMMLSESPNLVSFAERCIVPYLYGMSKALARGEPLPGLAHGGPGMLQDYAEMFGLKTREQVARALRLCGMRPRIANKCRCPCGCGRKLLHCPLRLRLNAARLAASRAWFTEHAAHFERSMRAVPPARDR
jgi:hypothetical protein